MTGELLGLAALGAVLGLDGTSVGQFMVSRPIVAGLLAGYVVGDPLSGALIGSMLELYLLVSFPTGGARFPEGATATVVAVGVAAALEGSHALPLAVGFGLVWGHLAGASVSALRKVNSRLVPHGERVDARRVVSAHTGAIALDAARAGVVTVVGVLGGSEAVQGAAESWPLDAAGSRALLLVGGMVSIGILLNDLGGARKQGLLFAIGAAAGMAVAWGVT